MRHAWIRLRPQAAWQTLDPAAKTRLERWFACGLPAVMARLQGGEPPGHWRLGVALPPSEGKSRLGLIVPYDGIRNWLPPLPLHQIIDAAPSGWRYALRNLLDRTGVLGLEPRVYGSFAWQTSTGLEYVTADSDLDLVWRPRNRLALQTVLRIVADWEAEHGRRADGEILLPDDSGVCWRELAGGSRRVLVKTAQSALLRSRDQILDLFPKSERANDDGQPVLVQLA